MNAENEPIPALRQKKTAEKVETAELSVDALRNLTGFLDVLIQMDLIHQSNERSSNATTIQNINGDNPQTD